MSERETIQEFERDGWNITVELVPDYDYRPGEDDDMYPRFEEIGYYGEDEEPRDYDGRFLPKPIIVDFRHGQMKVTPEEIDRLTEISGGNPRRMRQWIAETAQAIGHEYLSWVGVIVTATRDGASGSDSLWAVEYDLRESPPEKYALEVVEEHSMAETAIEEAARSVLGSHAVLALSY